MNKNKILTHNIKIHQIKTSIYLCVNVTEDIDAITYIV